MPREIKGNKIEHTTPLVVASTEWADTLPDWLKDTIAQERLIDGMVNVMKPQKEHPSEEVGLAEVLAYTMTASNVMPLSSDMTNIHRYCATQVMTKRGIEVPNDIRIDKLNEYEEGRLRDLKGQIYRARGGRYNNPVISVLEELKSKNKLTQDEIHRSAPHKRIARQASLLPKPVRLRNAARCRRIAAIPPTSTHPMTPNKNENKKPQYSWMEIHSVNNLKYVII